MKNFKILSLALVLVNFFAIFNFASAETIIYSDHEPLGNMRTTFLHEIFFKNIEKESRGNLKIEEHWNSELSTGYDALKKN